MKRFLVLVVIAAAAAFAIWVGLRMARGKSSAVTQLLPKDTVLLAHAPDLPQTREQWHHSDIYQIWREPAVQAFLEKPLTKMPPTGGVSEGWRNFMRLEPKDLFVAVTSIAENEPRITVGFRFAGSAADAEKVIAPWKEKLSSKGAGKTERSDYQGHQIDTVAGGRFSVASVYDRDWFFASNDVAALKVILDRVDGRLNDQKTSLAGDETFTAAKAHMPADYAAMVYLQPQRLVERIGSVLALSGRDGAGEQLAMLRAIRSFCGTTGFDGGKLRDVTFVGMPEAKGGRLARTSLAATTRDTFLYAAVMLNVAWQIQSGPDAAALPGPGAALQQMFHELAAHGITAEQWNGAFGDELGLIGDWVPDARWPSVLVSLPVRDFEKAKAIAEAMTTLHPGQEWTRSESNGAVSYSLQTIGGFVPITPSILVSATGFIAGLDSAQVQEAAKRGAATDAALTKSETYQNAARSMTDPSHAFTYLDTKLLVERLDVTLRPLLLMGAAFVPALSQNADFTKLPPADVITKHLSPIVMSQRFDRDGYVTESTGPITMNQGALGLTAGFIGGYWRNAMATP